MDKGLLQNDSPLIEAAKRTHLKDYAIIVNNLNSIHTYARRSHAFVERGFQTEAFSATVWPGYFLPRPF